MYTVHTCTSKSPVLNPRIPEGIIHFYLENDQHLNISAVSFASDVIRGKIYHVSYITTCDEIS